MPLFLYASTVDDALMGITTVVRAEEHLTNTLRQCLILEALKYPQVRGSLPHSTPSVSVILLTSSSCCSSTLQPQYAHCSLILGEDRSKLSKRHGATSVDQFKQEGFLPEAMNNYLALLGWNDGTEEEVFSVSQSVCQ